MGLLFVVLVLSVYAAKDMYATTPYSTDNNIFYAAPLQNCLMYHRFMSNGNYYYVKFQNTDPKVTYYSDELCEKTVGALEAPDTWTIQELDLDTYTTITTPAGSGVTLVFSSKCGKVTDTTSLDTKVESSQLTLRMYNNAECKLDDNDKAYYSQKFTCQDKNVFKTSSNQNMTGEPYRARITCGASLFFSVLSALLFFLF
ncbi:hypothetical protein EIN_221890 [Entamoeba invadens IP1]|uniref:Uncharacterized protein n=1 Tax=Entamoeba invadens IP1 TaxID=370355 RepID=A0A0A1U1X8_ENTIV|nr:hypothetical protein EIN_221890 [Entamoeba invadens IP1]ELP88056.1 hypothetical protein EIN_221890 [Entamoeba invadens IP1]|eukprot:XP_004254827.1 hypothetical protein EIN_221890 [Entamoeba invadens IP1]